MKTSLKKLCSFKTLKILAAFLIPALFVLFQTRAIDNDSWDVIAQGREIAQNGIYYTDQLSMHEGLEVTVQNYGFSIIFYWIFQCFGAPGLYLGMLILNFAICFLLYKICMLLSDKNTNLSLLIMVLTNLLLALSFVTTRAQMVSFVIFLSAIYALELFVKTGKVKSLFILPFLSLLQVNMHASLWWMLILLLFVYIIDSIKAPKLHLHGYRTKPLLIATVFVILFGMINPYGIKMITFILTSYGDARFHSMIKELASFSPFRSVFCAFTYLSIVAVLFLYSFAKNRQNIRMRYLLMFFGFLALGLNTVKGLSQFILTMSFPLALLYRDVRIERIIESKKGRNVLIAWTGAICLLSFAILCPLCVSLTSNKPDQALVDALDAIDSANDQDKKSLAIYSGYNDGGYVEYRGYKPYMDPRGEVFLKRNNKKEDILYEYNDFMTGQVTTTDLLEKYSFDYILVRGEKDPFFKLEDDRYETIYKNESWQTIVFKKINIR